MTSPEYVAARAVLLDALVALAAHRDALVLVGAQAVYLHAGEADLVTAPTTTDADIALTPGRLGAEPLLGDALRAAGFVMNRNPGSWRGRGDVAIDLMVPAALCGPGGRRGARIPIHGNNVARRTPGLEAAVVDNEFHELSALDPADLRHVRIRVAGPAALLVAKVTKIDERRGDPRRMKPKDGLDVLRLLRAVSVTGVAERLRALALHDISAEVTRCVIASLRSHGTDRKGPIASLAAAAVAGSDDPITISESAVILISDLLQTYDAH